MHALLMGQHGVRPFYNSKLLRGKYLAETGGKSSYNELVKFLILFTSAQIVRAVGQKNGAYFGNAAAIKGTAGLLLNLWFVLVLGSFRNGLDRDRNGRVRVAHLGTLGEAHLCGEKG